MKLIRLFAPGMLVLTLTSCGALSRSAGSLLRAPTTLFKGMSGAVGRSVGGILGQADRPEDVKSEDAIAKRGVEIQQRGPLRESSEVKSEPIVASVQRR